MQYSVLNIDTKHSVYTLRSSPSEQGFMSNCGHRRFSEATSSTCADGRVSQMLRVKLERRHGAQ